MNFNLGTSSILLISIITIFVFVLVESRPGKSNDPSDTNSLNYKSEKSGENSPNVEMEYYECIVTKELGEMCERCAKVTKSRLAYPMCCKGEDDARAWCERFLNFGIPDHPPSYSNSNRDKTHKGNNSNSKGH